jgi:hypothetical protein
MYAGRHSKEKKEKPRLFFVLNYMFANPLNTIHFISLLPFDVCPLVIDSSPGKKTFLEQRLLNLQFDIVLAFSLLYVFKYTILGKSCGSTFLLMPCGVWLPLLEGEL